MAEYQSVVPLKQLDPGQLYTHEHSTLTWMVEEHVKDSDGHWQTKSVDDNGREISWFSTTLVSPLL